MFYITLLLYIFHIVSITVSVFLIFERKKIQNEKNMWSLNGAEINIVVLPFGKKKNINVDPKVSEEVR